MANLRPERGKPGARRAPSGTSLAGYSGVLTWAITFLLIAIFAGIFGFVAAGPVGLILFAAFFIGFLVLLAKDRAQRGGR